MIELIVVLLGFLIIGAYNYFTGGWGATGIHDEQDLCFDILIGGRAKVLDGAETKSKGTLWLTPKELIFASVDGLILHEVYPLEILKKVELRRNRIGWPRGITFCLINRRVSFELRFAKDWQRMIIATKGPL